MDIKEENLDIIDVESLNQDTSFIEKYVQFKLNEADDTETIPDFPDILKNTLSPTKTPSKFITGLPRQHFYHNQRELKNLIELARDRSNLELDDIQKYFGEVLDFIDSLKTEKEEAPTEEGEETKEKEEGNPLIEKIKSIERIKNQYYEVEKQVRDLIEQLELVERYKMESVE